MCLIWIYRQSCAWNCWWLRIIWTVRSMFLRFFHLEDFAHTWNAVRWDFSCTISWSTTYKALQRMVSSRLAWMALRKCFTSYEEYEPCWRASVCVILWRNNGPIWAYAFFLLASMGRMSIDDGRSSIPHIQPFSGYPRIVALFQGRHAHASRVSLSRVVRPFGAFFLCWSRTGKVTGKSLCHKVLFFSFPPTVYVVLDRWTLLVSISGTSQTTTSAVGPANNRLTR